MFVKGILKSVSKKQGNTNGRDWVMYSYQLDNGKSYTSFKNFNVNPGDSIEICLENKNGNWQVSDIKAVEAATVAVAAPHQQQQTKPAQNSQYNPERELGIIRQSSIKAAIEIVANNLDVNKVIMIADLLVEYCQSGNTEQLQEKLSEILVNELEYNKGLECGI